MPHSVTVELPDSLYKRLVRAAELLGEPAGDVVVNSLAHTLPPVLDEIPAEYQGDVLPLLTMDEAGLQREISRVFPPRAWREYETLLDRKRERELTQGEAGQLDALRRRADVLTFRRAYAAVLLKRRGASVPALHAPGSPP